MNRGIPSGYIALLEQRLLETEIVLFELLTPLHHSHIPQHRVSQDAREILAKVSNAQSKNEKIEEWKRLPLALDEQRQQWLQTREEIILNSRRQSEKRRRSSGTSQKDTPSAGRMSQESPDSMQFRPGESPQGSSCIENYHGEMLELVNTQPTLPPGGQSPGGEWILPRAAVSEPLAVPSEEHNPQHVPRSLLERRESYNTIVDTSTDTHLRANHPVQRWRKYF